MQRLNELLQDYLIVRKFYAFHIPISIEKTVSVLFRVEEGSPAMNKARK